MIRYNVTLAGWLAGWFFLLYALLVLYKRSVVLLLTWWHVGYIVSTWSPIVVAGIGARHNEATDSRHSNGINQPGNDGVCNPDPFNTDSTLPTITTGAQHHD